MLEDFKDEQALFYDEVVNSILVNNKISHAYLIESKGYDKTRELVLAFAKFLLCPSKSIMPSKCKTDCNLCSLIDSNSYSNLKIIDPDGLWIKKEQLESLKIDFKTKSIDSSPRVYIIFDADKLNKNSANSILKFLEEPEENIIAILVTSNRYNVLNTIVSRCQLITLNNNLNLTSEDFINFDEGLNFFMDYERNNIKLFAYFNTTFNLKSKNRDDYYQLLKIMEFLYDLTLKYKIGKTVDSSISYYNDIIYIASLNSIDDIIRKMNVIENQKARLQYNVNLSLLLDKFIIDLSGGVVND